MPLPATPAPPACLPLRWDLFCRVVDNFGDVGVCWRLARQLATRGQQVRLVIDDDSALAWMAPGGAPGVQVQRWPGDGTPGDVVVEAFGCDPPPGFVQAMAGQQQQPVWINLEYLSAEPFVERSHGLPSPQRNGLMKWFFYPGFTPRTGGLLREQGLITAQDRFDSTAWQAAHGLTPQPGERVVSLFCYDNPALPALIDALSAVPTLLLLTPGPAQRQVPDRLASPQLRLVRLPWLSQDDYDRLLWSCDLNLVRGEDSLVRALWAGVPCVWQAYPQHDGAHHAKVDALMATWAGLPMPPAVKALWQLWNGAAPGLAQAREIVTHALDAEVAAPWRQAALQWRAALLAQADLASQLQGFAEARRGAAAAAHVR